jgi:predicted RNA-binding protein with PIN domain
VVDGNNVMGSVPDGWWRDRPGAVRRLLGRLQHYAEGPGRDVVLVLDVPQADLPAGPHGGVEVVYPDRRGRNAADDRILRLLDESVAGPGVEVVTSDRGLAAGVADRGVPVVGARTFLARLDAAGC